MPCRYLARRLVSLLEGDRERLLRCGAQAVEVLGKVLLDGRRCDLRDESAVLAAVAVENAKDLMGFRR